MKWTTITEKMNLVGGADRTPGWNTPKMDHVSVNYQEKGWRGMKKCKKNRRRAATRQKQDCNGRQNASPCHHRPDHHSWSRGGIDTLNVPSIGGDDNANVPSTSSTSAHLSSEGVDPTSGQSVASSSETSAGPIFKRVKLSHPKAPRKAPFSEKLLQVERDKLGVMREMLSVQKQHLEVRLCFIHFRRYLIPDQFWNVFKWYLSKYLFIYFVLFT